jgi:hypothetical protein
MKLDHVRKMRDRTPFRPFQIYLSNGEVLPVSRPENISLPTEEAELFVVWVGRDWNLLETGQIARISVQRKVAK